MVDVHLNDPCLAETTPDAHHVELVRASRDRDASRYTFAEATLSSGQ